MTSKIFGLHLVISVLFIEMVKAEFEGREGGSTGDVLGDREIKSSIWEMLL